MKKQINTALFDKQLLKTSFVESFRKLDPRKMIKNPIMFTVEVVTAVMLLLLIYIAVSGDDSQGSFWYNLVVFAVLLLTVLFANFAEAIAEQLVDERLPERVASSFQAACNIVLELVSGQCRVLLFEPGVAGDPEPFSRNGFPVPDIEKRWFIGEESLDQAAEERRKVFGISLMCGPEKCAHGVNVEHVRTGGIASFAEGEAAVTLFEHLKIMKRVIGIFPHDFAAALAAGPVEFIVEPHGREAETFPFGAQILQFTSGPGIDQKLGYSDLPQCSQCFGNHVSVRFSGHRSHRNQRTLSLQTHLIPPAGWL